jgi:hypothetical protein
MEQDEWCEWRDSSENDYGIVGLGCKGRGPCDEGVLMQCAQLMAPGGTGCSDRVLAQ